MTELIPVLLFCSPMWGQHSPNVPAIVSKSIIGLTVRCGLMFLSFFVSPRLGIILLSISFIIVNTCSIFHAFTFFLSKWFEPFRKAIHPTWLYAVLEQVALFPVQCTGRTGSWYGGSGVEFRSWTSLMYDLVEA